MHNLTTTNRRAGRGALIVRASTVAVGLAASVGLQFWGHGEHNAVQPGMAVNPSIDCAANANASFAVL